MCNCTQGSEVSLCVFSPEGAWCVCAALQERGHLAGVAQTSWRNSAIFSSDLQQVGTAPLVSTSALSALVCLRHWARLECKTPLWICSSTLSSTFDPPKCICRRVECWFCPK